MRSFSEENYRDIQSLFIEKTGVPLRRRRAARVVPFALAAAVLAALLTVTALAADLFSPLAGDDLSLGAVYEGDGIVSVHVENRSDKELKFQEQLRLMRWDTSEEIAPKRGAAVRFTNTAFEAHTEGVMTLDLSAAYDLSTLDEPLAQGGYYLVLTNGHFVFGQDWMCFIRAAAPDETGETAEAAPEKTPEPTAAPPAPAETDAELTARVEETLLPYFELSGDVAQRAGDADGGAPIPVVYLFTYFREDVENADYLFVHGQLVPLAEIEDRRVYEDERHVCYELSEYFYTDVQAHAETLCAQRGDVCWNDAARQRVQEIYDYYTNAETLARLIRHLAA